MKSLEEYKKLNYKAVVQYDQKEDSYFVEFPELPGCMADAATAADAIEKALKAKDEWLEIAFEAGYKIPEPAVKLETTGRQTVRMPKSLHARVLERAEEEGVSQNQLILSFIAEGLTKTSNQEVITRELQEIQGLRKELSKLLMEASTAFGDPWFSARSWKSAERLMARVIDANTARESILVAGWPSATYATADVIPMCQETIWDLPQAALTAAAEESSQGGYQS
jgi:antitoxin HicB